jgi:hypothetical protein
MRFALILPLLALTACVNAVRTQQDATGDAGRTQPFTAPGTPANDTSGAPEAPDEPADEPADTTEDPTAPPPGADPDQDGVVDAGEPGPAPAYAAQSCTEWTDCGPHFADENSGFDCVSGTCTCDDTGQWAQACADIGGSWSSWECFCFTNTDTAMPTAAPETPEQADDDVTCWWSWRLRYCDPDEWVDTSYYDHVCDGDECYDEYVERGYYVDGQCYGRWIKRCTDGNEYWY